MQVIDTAIHGAKIVQPKVFGDVRGFFLETFEKRRYQEMLDIDVDFVQDNHSRSSKGVLRGLHFQKTKPQGKLVRVVRGEVFDVAVDIRQGSPSYGEWCGVTLSRKQNPILASTGAGAWFCRSLRYRRFQYKCTDYYDPSDEGCLLWNDPDVGIEWPITDPLLSEKDKLGQLFKDLAK
nr:dTDP-4-dehydrorhamnose 3,5-epimerase [Pectobacterium sp. PL152]